MPRAGVINCPDVGFTRSAHKDSSHALVVKENNFNGSMAKLVQSVEAKAVSLRYATDPSGSADSDTVVYNKLLILPTLFGGHTLAHKDVATEQNLNTSRMLGTCNPSIVDTGLQIAAFEHVSPCNQPFIAETLGGARDRSASLALTGTRHHGRDGLQRQLCARTVLRPGTPRCAARG